MDVSNSENLRSSEDLRYLADLFGEAAQLLRVHKSRRFGDGSTKFSFRPYNRLKESIIIRRNPCLEFLKTYEADLTNIGVKVPDLLRLIDSITELLGTPLAWYPEIRQHEVDWAVRHISDIRAGDKETRRPLTTGEKRIWDALEHTTLTGRELVQKLHKSYDQAASEGGIRQHISNMKLKGYEVANKRGRGYYRLNDPPQS